MWRLFLIALFFSFPHMAHAQVFSDTPLCLSLANNTGGEVLGHVETAEYHDDMGKLSWHRNNFRLATNETGEVCSTGPFFDGYQLRVVVKTIMPLYSCKTDMNRTLTISKIPGAGGFNTIVMDCPKEE